MNLNYSPGSQILNLSLSIFLLFFSFGLQGQSSYCPDLLDGGMIAEGESECGPYDPEIIIGTKPPTKDPIVNSMGNDCCESGDKPREITFKYVGGSCNDSQNTQGSKTSCSGGTADLGTVNIVVSKSSGGSGDIFYSGSVNIGESFTAKASNGGSSDFPSAVYYSIYSPNGSLLQSLNIHHSCSAPLVIGEQFGGLMLEGLRDKNGIGCGVSSSGNGSTTGEDCCDTGGKSAKLTFEYIGGSCSDSQNTQGSKTSCSGGSANNGTVRIIVSKNSDGSDDVFFNGNVNLNEEFTASASTGGSSEFPSNVYLIIKSTSGSTLQTIGFHASCSAPIVPGEIFGALQLKYTEDKDGVGCGVIDPIFQYRWTSSTDGCPTESNDSIPGANGADYDPGVITETTYYVRWARMECPPPTSSGSDCCDSNDKPVEMTFQYVGGSCSDSQNSQGSKFSCSGGSASGIVNIIASDKSDGRGDIYFAGIVNPDGLFTIKASNAGEDKFSSETYLIIKAPNGTTLQTLNIHTSCSAPIVVDDQFGSVILRAIKDENGAGCGDPTNDGGNSDPDEGFTAWSASNCVIKAVTPEPSINITNLICDGKGTSETTDDTYTFDLTVNGTGTGWVGEFNNAYIGVFQFGLTPYGTTINMGPFAAGDFTPTNIFPPTVISGGIDISISVSDADNGSCSSTTVVESPGPCSPDPQRGSIGDRVWNDEDMDGFQDANEDGVPGVTVQLKDCNNAVLQTTQTDNNGNYSFDNLPEDCYRIGIVLPAGYTVSPQNAAGDASDSDINANNLMTGNIDLDEGEDDPTNDAGIFQPIVPTGSIGDRVWNDEDMDGFQDANEDGVPGVTVQLKDCNNAVLQTTQTDNNGNYSFDNLPEDCYRIGIVLPAGYTVSPQNAAGDASDSDIDANNLMTGNIDLDEGEDDPTNDAGIFQPIVPTGSIGDRVWNDEDMDGFQDADEDGVPGVTVQLKDCNNAVLQTTQTDNNGNYSFDNLPADCYRIGIVLPAGYTVSPQNAAGDANDSDINANNLMTGNIDLDEGEDDPTNDAGIFQPIVPTGSIGDRVWNDEDMDGFQDANEDGVPGVTVQLKDCNNAVLQTTQTDNNGNYSFDNLPADCYRIGIVLPAGYTVSPQNEAGDANDSDINANNLMTGNIDLDEGEDDPTNDAGIFQPIVPTGSIGDRVWNDEDMDGFQDADEDGVPGVTVQLKDCSNTVLQTTQTDNNGNYSFDNLPEDCYRIGIVLPAGYTVSPQNAAGDASDSDINANNLMTGNIDLDEGEDDPTNDAGIFQPIVPTGSIGDKVWNDTDGDGFQDPNEPGVPGVTVQLKNCSNQVLQTTQTNNVGFYNFTDLAAGCYRIGVALPNGFSYSPLNNAGDAADSDIISGTGMTGNITLDEGEDNPTVDAGLVPNPPGGCNVDYSVVNGKITITGLTDPITQVQIFDNSFNTLYECNSWLGPDCGSMVMYQLPNTPGKYFVNIKTYDSHWNPICTIFEEIGDTPPPCVIYASVSNITCNSRGTATPADDTYSYDLHISGGTGWGYTLNGVDFYEANFTSTTITQGPFLISSGTRSDIVVDYDNPTCIDQVTVNPPPPCSSGGNPCDNQGGDSDGDGVCADNDCDDSNPNISFPGDSCDDGNSNTISDVIQNDCSCAGTPVSSGCNVTWTVNGNTISVENLVAPITAVKIIDFNWNELYSCNDWTTPCNTTEVINGLPVGTYYIQVQTYFDWHTPICDIFETFVITGDPGGCDNVTSGGSISGDETICSGEDAGPISNVSFPSGGSGAIEYIWLSSTTACPNSLSDQIAGATGASYNPGVLTQTTYYRRCARRVGCTELTDWFAGESNCVTKTVDTDPNCGNTGCDNVTSGGTISGDETICSGDDAGPISNLTYPSGGSGAMEYIWLSSTTACPNSLSQQIQGATGSSYDPGVLNQTTYYRRCARRAGCNELTDWFAGESNCVVKTVDADPNCGNTGTGCTAVISQSGSNILISGLTAPINLVQIFDANWTTVWSCNDWSNQCGSSVSIPLTNGVYYAKVETLNDWNSPKVCDLFETIVLGANSRTTVFTTFDVAANQGVVDINWVNNSGPVNDYFEVEKSSNGTDFEAIEMVESLTNEATPKFYRQKDKKPFDGANFYRLKLTFKNGLTAYSEIKPINIADIEDFGLFPNPAQETVNVSLKGYEGTNIEIRLVDNFGKQMRSIEIENVSESTYQLPLTGVNNGMYSLWIFAEGKRPIGKKMIVNKMY